MGNFQESPYTLLLSRCSGIRFCRGRYSPLPSCWSSVPRPQQGSRWGGQGGRGKRQRWVSWCLVWKKLCKTRNSCDWQEKVWRVIAFLSFQCRWNEAWVQIYIDNILALRLRLLTAIFYLQSTGPFPALLGVLRICKRKLNTSTSFFLVEKEIYLLP